ncbi:fimbrial protein precursor [mine drainage metagenome]|uniref:Fimbrial protein n=1 Tax=mine drainage metagenome TaxID=410659 RepID=A0A1J5S6W7_9ZZZZ
MVAMPDSNAAVPPARGFTLIELMIVVTVVAILTMVAYPSYVNYVIRANRSQAQQFLMDIAQLEEQFRLDQGQYTADLADLGVATPAPVANYYAAPSLYTTEARPFFVAQLTPLANAAQKDDGRLFINSRGEHWRDTDGSCAISACVYSSASAIPWE